MKIAAQHLALLLVAVMAGAALALGVATVANAEPRGKVVQVDPPTHEVMRHNVVTWRVRYGWAPHWHRVWLRDGSSWDVTRCPTEESRNCFWNARVQGNGLGRSFVNIHGHQFWLKRSIDR
jgi:hypothetical protein